MTQACAPHPQPTCSSPPPCSPQPHEVNCHPTPDHSCAPSDCAHQALLCPQPAPCGDGGFSSIHVDVDVHLALDFGPDCCHV
jgi:hypothetical protein